MTAVIDTEGLTKHYGPVVAVEDLTLRVAAGEVFGMLGPNGSGKTTTILMLLGLTDPTSGTVRVLGYDPSRHPLEVKRRVGYLPDSVGFYDDLTARENLRYTARLNGLSRSEAESRIDEALARVGLTEVADRRVGAYSRGMRQRLGLADVLIKRPEIAILDEPTAGLDPEAAHEFLDLIRGLKAQGITILLASHLLHQVQAVCDRVGLFSRGRMVLEGTFESLADRILGGAYRIHVETARADGLEPALRAIPGVTRVVQERPGRFRLEAQLDCRAEVARQVVTRGADLLSLSLERPTLDEVYTRYFQEASREA
ncbi:MAG: ABC transporter ATP-binding protein [Armatimonadota bacterium]|nr:ABC transporter ATP-binding protein [Armatimonadota bacterium]MDR7401011.1 ABC transporter ATP-binding protein [Armatimonadota bacterium]MDR7403219.1 ABC transporter ATP-binding protein [Armatimonadota bacterium]MDR7436722.1 ABC transporter ATP-binding protein [Armatimonadota bacterium]MDR7471206.1 ABC transporter ATP-binding protein [Armatimonadota bacterium]